MSWPGGSHKLFYFRPSGHLPANVQGSDFLSSVSCNSTLLLLNKYMVTSLIQPGL